jgi:hypothetical protein
VRLHEGRVGEVWRRLRWKNGYEVGSDGGLVVAASTMGGLVGRSAAAWEAGRMMVGCHTEGDMLDQPAAC